MECLSLRVAFGSFDAGTMLVTAGVNGHSIHIFQICPAASVAAASRGDGSPCMGSAVHLYRYVLSVGHALESLGLRHAQLALAL